MISSTTERPKPTIADIAAELETLPTDALVRRLQDNPDLMDKATIAEARGQAGPHLAATIRSAALLEPWVQAIARVTANLTAAASHSKLENDGRPTPRTRRLNIERQRIIDRATEARDLIRAQRSDSPEDAHTLALRDLRRTYADEHLTSLTTALHDAGLPDARPHATPKPHGAWAWAVTLGLLTAEPDEQQLLDLDEPTFHELVVQDVNGTVTDALRLDGVLDRWADALAAAHKHDLALPEPTDPAKTVRRRRYRAALQARRGEVRRALLRRQDRIRLLVDELNSEPARHAARAAADTALLNAHPAEYMELLTAHSIAIAA